MNNIKKILLTLTMCWVATTLKAQTIVTDLNYDELPNPVLPNLTQWKQQKVTKVEWGNIDTRYKKEAPAPMTNHQTAMTLHGWKGEKVAAQLIISTVKGVKHLRYEISDLIHSKHQYRIDNSHILAGFVRYVMTDELNKDGKGGCGYRTDHSKFDSTLVADPIDPYTQELSMPAYTTQGIWVRIWIPQDAITGIYKANIKVKDGKQVLQTLRLTVNVSKHALPSPTAWNFHLDLWQNPFSIARYYRVPLWSDKHLEIMKPYMEMYRDAGGKVITASIIHKPWNGQTYDYYDTMVGWTRKIDGTWNFDYTIFDRWVEFMMGIGINKEICCYSMIPWKLSFSYYDEASHEIKVIHAKPGEEAYNEMWTSFLRSFAQHLKAKGWFGITHIAMDERPMETMKETLKIIHQADKDFKISMAGALYDELSDYLDDYCTALRMKFKDEILNKRIQEGKTTSFYTSCEEPFPNTFTFSTPAESEWMGWYAAKANLDGYLRWDFTHWAEKPLQDSRFRTWAAGDTYLVYPGPRTSIRFERLIQGIQAFEKIQILRREACQSNDKETIHTIDKTLQDFNELQLYSMPASEIVNKAKSLLEKF